jgi:hypothetical protein
LTVEQAYTRYVLRTDPSIPRDGMQPLAGDMNVELGYTYRSAAVIPESQDGERPHVDPRESRALPGTRAPHYWLEKDGRPISTLDLVGNGFTLLAAQDGAAWRQTFLQAAGELHVQAAAHQPGWDGLRDPTGGFNAAFGLEPEGCVLVRPDGFVAWRARNRESANAQRAGEVLRTVLGHG